jgi:hypothetical protein
MSLTVGGKEEGRCGVGVIHGGIPMTGLTLQVEVPTMTASISSLKVGEEC